MTRLRVVHVASEFTPLAKVGGLADAVAGLSRAQADRADVTVILPFYPHIRAAGPAITPQPLDDLVVGGAEFRFRLWRAELDRYSRVLLLESPRLFRGPGIYADAASGQDHPDPGLRFGAFCRGVLALLPRIDLRPDILHGHDHPAAFLPTLLRRSQVPGKFYARTGTVLTIHNAAHQGIHDPELLDRLGIDRSGFTPGGPLEFWGKYNALKAGILDADATTTVSPGYAREIQGALGCGLDGVFRERPPTGILNGIDTEVWNPAADPHLAATYTARAPSRRVVNREALVRRFDLDPARVIVGMVTRLADQKGLDLIRSGAERLFERSLSLVVLGSGDPTYRELFETLARERPGRVGFQSAFDDPLAHAILGGADLFLVPSRYEPCGLTQLMAMRYGAIPVVRRTGGLADTVRDADADEHGNGFTFDEYTPEALLGAVDRAIAAVSDPTRRPRLVRRIMGLDVSWTAPVRRYRELYDEVLERRRA